MIIANFDHALPDGSTLICSLLSYTQIVQQGLGVNMDIVCKRVIHCHFIHALVVVLLFSPKNKLYHWFSWFRSQGEKPLVQLLLE